MEDQKPKLPKPRLPLTVPLELWQKVAIATTPEYADSYLSGAQLNGMQLLPRTVTGWERIRDNRHAMAALTDVKVKLVKPPLFVGDWDD